ncbi:UDP-3-O-acylglucosamine N-acyltransferase, partial [Melia azedarach]
NTVVVRNFSAKRGGVENLQEFQKWHNGGGIFHQPASIDSTALVEVGAIVQSNGVLGANVCIGSGTFVGPAVTVGQSTKV